MKNLIAPLLGLFCLMTVSNAQADYSAQCESITVVYSNGMNTAQHEAVKESFDLEVFLSAFPLYETVEVRSAYNNTTGNLLADTTFEVFPQLAFNYDVKSWRLINPKLIGDRSESVEYYMITDTYDSYLSNPSLLRTGKLYVKLLEKGGCVIAYSLTTKFTP